MNATLPARVSALRIKLGQLKDLSSKASEASDLSSLRTDLEQPVQTLAMLVKRQREFEDLGVPTSAPESLGKLRSRAASVRERFRAERTSVTLKKGQAWKAMLAETATATVDVEKSLITAWKEFRSAIFAGDTPAKISGTLAGTQGNIDALDAYRATYDAFNRQFLTLPSDGAVVTRARDLAAELMLIAGRFDYNVEPDVKAFLAAVQAGGAPLSLLTPEVWKWLKDGEGMDAYRVRAAETQ
ncbi:MAG: hypothetical protein EON59_01495 [Alphaproteobacteria bacterium]|nr:MAG: hypothetical protein EON59_01495 [Alphaproteobacteria bacterium]